VQPAELIVTMRARHVIAALILEDANRALGARLGGVANQLQAFAVPLQQRRGPEIHKVYNK